jgi:hypothetical protein
MTLPATLATLAAASWLAATPGPEGRLEFEVLLVWADAGAGSGATDLVVAAEELRELGEILGGARLRELATDEFVAQSGEQVVRELAGGYRLSFGLGAPEEGGRVLLRKLELRRGPSGPEPPLLRADVRPSLGRPLALGLTRDPATSGTLLLMLTCGWQGPGVP